MSVNILVVDDSLPMRAVIKKTIQASGFRAASFFEASNGQEALSILKSQWMDLVVTDYNMPDMDGMELINAMKTDEILRSIPVLVVTTEGSRKRVEEFMEKGAADYIKKPFTPEVIRHKLNQILGEGENEREADGRAQGLDF